MAETVVKNEKIGTTGEKEMEKTNVKNSKNDTTGEKEMGKDFDKICFEFASYFKGKTDMPYYMTVMLGYLLYELRRNKVEHPEKLSEDELIAFISEEDERETAKEILFEVVKPEDLVKWDDLTERDLMVFLSTVEAEDFIFTSNFDEQCSSTPDCVGDLAYEIMDEIKEEEKVLDLCSGTGSFLLNASEKQKKAKYTGVESNKFNVASSKIKGKMQKKNITFLNANGFDFFDDEGFDKIFSNYPLGMRLKTLENSEFIDKTKEEAPELMKSTSADWLFNYKVISLLSEKGLAVVLMTTGGLVNNNDKASREFFLKTNKIETVIILPQKLFSYTQAPLAVVVFNNDKKGDGIRFIDATKEFKKERRQNTLTKENIDKIKEFLIEDSVYSRLVDSDEIIEKDYSFNPLHYLENKGEITDGVEFQNYVKRITRGAYYSAVEIDKMSSSTPTDCQFLMLSNIKDGVIDENLPYLKEIPSSMEKYCVKDGDLIMCKCGAPFKFAIAKVEKGKKVLASGNLYIIEIDSEKINPYYLKAFFESSLGQSALLRIAVGANIPNIAVSSLNKLLIPVASKEKQDTVAENYIERVNQIKICKEKIQKALTEIANMF